MRATHVQALVDVLGEQTELLKQLVELLQQDKRSVLQHDVQALEQSNLRKETLVMRLHAAERTRLECSARAALALGIPADQAVVSRLCAALGPSGQPLADAAEKLRGVLGGLRELVAVSHGFLEQSILGIRSLLGLIGSLQARGGGTLTYDATGRVTQPGAHAPAVALRQEA